MSLCFGSMRIVASLTHTHTVAREAILLVVWLVVHGVLILVSWLGTLFVSDAIGELAAVDSLISTLLALHYSPIDILLDTSFEVRLRWHRWLGVLAVALATVHLLFVAAGWFEGVSVANGLNVTGAASLLAGAVLFFSSRSLVRRHHFNAFFWLHFAFVPWFFFGAIHSLVMLRCTIAAVALYIGDRALRRVWSHSVWTALQSEKLPDCDVALLRVPRESLARAKLGIGSFVHLNVPQISSTQWYVGVLVCVCVCVCCVYAFLLSVVIVV